MVNNNIAGLMMHGMPSQTLEVKSRDIRPSMVTHTRNLCRLFMIFVDYKQMSGWIFTITGWLFSHTEATHCVQTPYTSDFCIIGPL